MTENPVAGDAVDGIRVVSHDAIPEPPNLFPPTIASWHYQGELSEIADNPGENAKDWKQDLNPLDGQVHAFPLGKNSGSPDTNKIQLDGMDQVTDDSEWLDTDDGSETDDIGEEIPSSMIDGPGSSPSDEPGEDIPEATRFDADTADTDGNAGKREQKPVSTSKCSRLVIIAAQYWIILPVGLGLHINNLSKHVPPSVLVSMADLVPFKIEFTLQGSVTTFFALMPLWITVYRRVIPIIRKAFSSLGFWGYWTLLTMFLDRYDPEMTVMSSVRNIHHIFFFGDWQVNRQMAITALFFSTPLWIFVARGLESIYQCALRPFLDGFLDGFSSIHRDSVPANRRLDQPFQPGLGTLGILPPEIRSEIWKELFKQSAPNPHPCIYETEDSEIVESDERRAYRRAKIISKTHTTDQPNTLESYCHGSLTILRASKQLYDEIGGELYRNRTLHICFDNNEHGLLPQRLEEKLTDYYVRLDGFCLAKNLAHIDFSLFNSLHLDIELPSNVCSRDKMADLEKDLEDFSAHIQVWQSRKYPTTRKRCPPISIDIRLHKSTQLYDYEWSETPQWEVSLRTVMDLLEPLSKLDNADDATIKVHFKLRYGQEWLSQVLYEVIYQMKHVGRKHFRHHRDTSSMCYEAYSLTEDTLGSDVGGTLSKEPPHYSSVAAWCSKYHGVKLNGMDTDPQLQSLRVLPTCEQCRGCYVGDSQSQDTSRARTMSLKIIFTMTVITVPAMAAICLEAICGHLDKLLAYRSSLVNLFQSFIGLAQALPKFIMELLNPLQLAIIYWLGAVVQHICNQPQQDTPFAGLSLDEELSLDAFMWTNIVTCLVIGPRVLFAEYVEMFLIYIMACFIPWMGQSIATENPTGSMPEDKSN